MLAPEDSEKTFQVSRVLLVTSSSWFEKALSKEFQEGQKRVLKLLDTTTETVENFVFWLYTNRNPFKPSARTHTEDEEAHRAAAIHFWAFGDKHLIPSVQQIGMLALMRSMGEGDWPSLKIIKLAYTVSAPGSALRELLSDISIEGIKARLTKTPRRRHEKRVTVATPEGYALADFEQIEDTPGLLLDILKGFACVSPVDATTLQSNSMERYRDYLKRIAAEPSL